MDATMLRNSVLVRELWAVAEQILEVSLQTSLQFWAGLPSIHADPVPEHSIPSLKEVGEAVGTTRISSSVDVGSEVIPSGVGSHVGSSAVISCARVGS